MYNINTGQWTTQFVARYSHVPENEPGQADYNKNRRDGEAGKIVGIVIGVTLTVAILIAVTRYAWKHAVRRGLQDQQERGQGHGQGQERGKGKDLEDNDITFEPSDQTLEEVTEAGYFGNVAPQQIAAGSPLHCPPILSPPPPTSPAYPSPPLSSHLPPHAIVAPRISAILGDAFAFHQTEPQPRHDPQLHISDTENGYVAPEPILRNPQGWL